MNLKAILIAATLVVGGAAIAQTGAKSGSGGRPGVQGAPGGPGGQMRSRTPEERVERLSKNLNLSADQKKKVLAIYKASAAKGKTLFEDKKMTREQKMKAFEKFRDENNNKIKAILTKDQMKKYEAMRQRRPGQGAGGAKPGGAKAGGGKSGG